MSHNTAVCLHMDGSLFVLFVVFAGKDLDMARFITKFNKKKLKVWKIHAMRCA